MAKKTTFTSDRNLFGKSPDVENTTDVSDNQFTKYISGFTLRIILVNFELNPRTHGVYASCMKNILKLVLVSVSFRGGVKLGILIPNSYFWNFCLVFSLCSGLFADSEIVHSIFRKLSFWSKNS